MQHDAWIWPGYKPAATAPDQPTMTPSLQRVQGDKRWKQSFAEGSWECLQLSADVWHLLTNALLTGPSAMNPSGHWRV